MGRHPKPKLTPREAEAIKGKGYRIAAAIVSDMRGANAVSISPFEARKRRVSARWLADELRGNNPVGKSVAATEATPRGEITGDAGIRDPESTVHKTGDIPERPSEPANKVFTPKVESEQSGGSA